MSPLALGLLVAAGVLHAGWNLQVKQAVEKQIFTWLALVSGVVVFSPLLLLGSLPPGDIWPLVIGSALAEAAYFVILTYSYQLGDFSLIYPLARGAAPALLALWTTLFLGERFSVGGLAGLGLLLGGLLLVGGGGFFLRRAAGVAGGRGFSPAVPAALAVALCISIYSVIDGAAMRTTSGPPYVVLVVGLSALLISPLLLRRYGREPLLVEWRRNWPRIVLVGATSNLVLIMVLQAYAISRVGYAGAIREISVVFGALAGWRLLGESFGPWRTAGSLLIFAGIVVIALVG